MATQRMIIGVAAKKRSGKDTLCTMLQSYEPFTKISFASALWDILLAADPWIPDSKGEFWRLSILNQWYGYEHCKTHYPEVRRLMQRLGTQGVREHIGQTTWLDIVIKQIKANPWTNYIVPDVRFDNEAAALQALGAVIVKLERDSTDSDEHISESIQGIHQDLLYVNNSSLSDLDTFAQGLIRSMKS